jgi:hypothetical protein
MKDSLSYKPFDIYVIDCENQSSVEKLTEYVEKEEINYSYLLNGKKILSKYKVSGYATFFLIDTDKKIVDMIIWLNLDILNKMIEKIK